MAEVKEVKFTPREKVLLEILIHEIQEALPDIIEVDKVLDSWVKANDLHPNKVMTIKPERGIE